MPLGSTYVENLSYLRSLPEFLELTRMQKPMIICLLRGSRWYRTRVIVQHPPSSGYLRLASLYVLVTIPKEVFEQASQPDSALFIKIDLRVPFIQSTGKALDDLIFSFQGRHSSFPVCFLRSEVLIFGFELRIVALKLVEPSP